MKWTYIFEYSFKYFQTPTLSDFLPTNQDRQPTSQSITHIILFNSKMGKLMEALLDSDSD